MGCSWRVPFTVLNGPLTVRATLDIGGLGPHESQPEFLPWQWYYHLPQYAGCALIVSLLLLVKENRNRQAWLILVPFLLLSEIFRPWIERVLLMLGGGAGRNSLPLQWLVFVWTVVWLVSPWLARRRLAVAFVLVPAFAVSVGFVAEFALYQFMYVNRLEFPRYFYGMLSQDTYLVAIFAMLLAFTLSALCCRRTYRPRRFVLWLAFWLFVSVVVGMTGDAVWIFYKLGRLDILPSRLPLVGLMSLCMAGALYLFNLPFMVLVFRCPLYRDRFHRLLRLPEESHGGDVGDAESSDGLSCGE